MGTIMKTDSDNYHDIADAIRDRGATSDTYLPSEMAGAIRAIPSGGGVNDSIIANEYDSTSTYSIGDYVIYNSNLYICTTDISSPEEWDNTHWSQTAIDSELNQIKGNIEDNSNSISNLYDDIADEFSTSATYSVGDYVIYNNNLYKCTTAVTVAGAWTGSTNWTQTQVVDEFGSGGGGATTLDGLTDVTITSATNGQVLTYDTTSGKWINSNGGGSGTPTSIIAPNYDSTATYSVGDYCIESNTLYICIMAINTPEAFDNTKWLSVNIGEELEDKMDKHNPRGTGSIAIGDSVTSATGTQSQAFGSWARASGDYSQSMGYMTLASGWCSEATGQVTEATGSWSVAKGRQTKANGDYSYAGGSYVITNGYGAFAHGKSACDYDILFNLYLYLDNLCTSEDDDNFYFDSQVILEAPVAFKVEIFDNRITNFSVPYRFEIENIKIYNQNDGELNKYFKVRANNGVPSFLETNNYIGNSDNTIEFYENGSSTSLFTITIPAGTFIPKDNCILTKQTRQASSNIPNYITAKTGSLVLGTGIDSTIIPEHQIVLGCLNQSDANKLFILGNGEVQYEYDSTYWGLTGKIYPSNAMTVDWDGNTTISGDLTFKYGNSPNTSLSTILSTISGAYIEVTGTLTAGSTILTLSDPAILTTSTFEFFTDTFGVSPTAVSVSTGSITLTFPAQQANLGVKVRIT